MIFVVGQPRTGTSWVMQLLHSLGVPLIGDKFPSWLENEHNPSGYWEDRNWMTARGQAVEGHAVKVMLRKAVEYKLDVTGHTLILCDRDRMESAISQHKMMDRDIQRAINHDTKWYAEFHKSFSPDVVIDFAETEEMKISKLKEVTSGNLLR